MYSEMQSLFFGSLQVTSTVKLNWLLSMSKQSWTIFLRERKSSRAVNGVVNDEVVDEQLIFFFKVYKKTLRSRQGLKREKQ